jgi:uncharacterized protein YbjT (DUF2867 family)
MILAAGATGRLRPVVEELLARGQDVRVTARDPRPHWPHRPPTLDRKRT